MTTLNFILRFPKEIKIQCLKDALVEDKIGIFIGLSKILLDATIKEGGLCTEIIEGIYNKYRKITKFGKNKE